MRRLGPRCGPGSCVGHRRWKPRREATPGARRHGVFEVCPVAVGVAGRCSVCERDVMNKHSFKLQLLTKRLGKASGGSAALAGDIMAGDRGHASRDSDTEKS
jgi:hypothetical protein